MAYYRKTEMPTPADALPGREIPMPITNRHFVLNHPLRPPFPDDLARIGFGMGCFWGAERAFWKLPGVYTTAVGYAAGFTTNPNYQEVCTGMTGHNEVVLVVFDPREIALETLFQTFWQSHDPTQGMRQGNDIGTQYRSGIYCADDAQQTAARESLTRYQAALRDAGHGDITTEILPAPTFYYAEDYHQQYLAKNPEGYCGLGGLDVAYPR